MDILKTFVTRNAIKTKNEIHNPNLYDLEVDMNAEIYDDKPNLVDYKNPIMFTAKIKLILNNPLQILVRNETFSRYVKLNQIKKVWY